METIAKSEGKSKKQGSRSEGSGVSLTKRWSRLRGGAVMFGLHWTVVLGALCYLLPPAALGQDTGPATSDVCHSVCVCSPGSLRCSQYNVLDSIPRPNEQVNIANVTEM